MSGAAAEEPRTYKTRTHQRTDNIASGPCDRIYCSIYFTQCTNIYMTEISFSQVKLTDRVKSSNSRPAQLVSKAVSATVPRFHTFTAFNTSTMNKGQLLLHLGNSKSEGIFFKRNNMFTKRIDLQNSKNY